MSDSNDFYQRVLDAVRKEMDRQQEKWGIDRRLHPQLWLTVLAEEFGEVANALLEGSVEGYETEMIHVATVAIAALMDWHWTYKEGTYLNLQIEPSKWVG